MGGSESSGEPESQLPTPQNFMELVERKWDEGKFVCIGLDSDVSKLPQKARSSKSAQAMVYFNKEIIDATHRIAAAYKPNIAFYEEEGGAGIDALEETIHYIKRVNPSVPVILDAKRGDIGNTNLGYVRSAFDRLRADAITVSPYLGRKALEPFLERTDKGIFILARTSNEGADEFQDLLVDGERPLYQVIADHAVNQWNDGGNIGLVMGATNPEELGAIRGMFPEVPLLIPGVGAQGGDLEQVVDAAQGRFLINSSRGIIFASAENDFAQAAGNETRRLHEGIAAAIGR